MDRAPWFEIGAETADKDTESDVNRKKALGERASRSLFGKEKEDDTEEKSERTKKQKAESADKETSNSKNQEAKKPFKLFEFKTEKDTATKQKITPENSAQNTEVDAMKAAAVTALREQLPINIAKLETELATTTPDTPEFEAAEAALSVEKLLQEKAEDPTIEALPEIDAEFDRRIAEIIEEQTSETLPSNGTETDRSNQPELPSFDELVAVPKLRETPPRATHNDGSGERSHDRPREESAPGLTESDTGPAEPDYKRDISVPSGYSGASVGAEATAAPLRQTQEKKESSTQAKQRRASAFVSGGVIGYALGRRSGKKRSEARLNPRIETLEIETRKTKERLASRETELKSIVREQHLKTAQPKVEITPLSTIEHPVSSVAQPVLKEVRPDQATVTPKTTETLPPVRHLNQHDTVSVPLQAGETDPVNIFERESMHKPEQKTSPERITAHEIKHIEQLSTPELLQRASMLYISGTSVKELYTTNQIDRRGLISIVQESMRGRDIKAAFEKVELGLERQRERAREFRHDDTTLTATSPPAPGLTVAKPLGHTVVHEANTAVHAPNHPPINLPNNPRSEDLQPLQGVSTHESETTNNHSDSELFKPVLPLEYKLAAGAAVVIIVLIAWVFLS